jgi:hypothetical protein
MLKMFVDVIGSDGQNRGGRLAILRISLTVNLTLPLHKKV